MTAPTTSQPTTGHAGSAPAPSLFPTLPVEVGDYTLTHLLGIHASSEYYIARQNHVERRVVLEVLRPEAGEAGQAQVAQFFARARARVAARLPHVAPVLESATTPEGYCTLSQPLPDGEPLSAMIAEGQKLTVLLACKLVQEAGELCEACAQAGLATTPLTADMVFKSHTGHFNFLSPVLEGTPEEGSSARQQRALASLIRPLQPTNVPGQTRLATLLSWMQEGYEGEALDWPAITSTAALIAEQLNPEAILHLHRPKRYDRGREERADKRRRRMTRKRWLLAGAALTTVLAMGVGGTFLAPDTAPPLPAQRNGKIYVKFKGKVQKVAERPVSIAEYRQFLEEFPALDNARQGSITQNVPPADSDPTPSDWQAQSTAAAQGSQWQGRQLAEEAPVTNVSYWQALMYARYRRATLPSAALLAAARAEAGNPGVEEWTLDEVPPMPPYARARIVLPATAGASPIPESNPAARNPQRSFRICP